MDGWVAEEVGQLAKEMMSLWQSGGYWLKGESRYRGLIANGHGKIVKITRHISLRETFVNRKIKAF